MGRINYFDGCRMWVNHCIAGGGPNVYAGGKYGSNYRLFSIHTGALFSYGMHFEIARPLRSKKGELVAFLFNGDTHGPTTGRHQSEARAAVDRAGYKRVIIPHSAIAAAEIDRSTIQLIDATRDTTEVTQHSSLEVPRGYQLEWLPLHHNRELFPEELEAQENDSLTRRTQYWEERMAYAAEEKREDVPGERRRHFWRDWAIEHPDPPQREVADPGQIRWFPSGHHLVCRKIVGSYYPEIKMEYLPNGQTLYTWETSRHWLGESVIRARYAVALRTRCATCKGRGIWPGPWEYDLHARPRCQRCLGRGIRTRTVWRWGYFLSGFDHNEKRRSYFFCQLPRGARPTTVDEAYDCLKPGTVRLAEQMGRSVVRQGDIFAIPVANCTLRALRARGAVLGRMVPILGTNHIATDTPVLGGVTYVRGCLHHKPAGRDPDHARVRLPVGWHIAVKNLVPISG